MNIAQFHVFSLPSPAGNPLFVAQLWHLRRPYATVESCTSEGRLTLHLADFPHPRDLDMERELAAFIMQESQTGIELPDLYPVLADRARRELGRSARHYYASRAHKADVAALMHNNYLSPAQLAAWQRMIAGNQHPWNGTPEYERAQRDRSRRFQGVARVTAARAKAIRQQTDWSPTALERRMLSPPTGPQDNIQLVPTAKGRAGGLNALTWAHFICRTIAPVPYMPADLTHYMAWSEARRDRFVSDRISPGHRNRPWKRAEPFLPDTPDARAWVNQYPDELPSNWEDLPDDIQFDPRPMKLATLPN